MTCLLVNTWRQLHLLSTCERLEALHQLPTWEHLEASTGLPEGKWLPCAPSRWLEAMHASFASAGSSDSLLCAYQHHGSASPAGTLTCLGVRAASLLICGIQLGPYSMDLPFS